MQFTHLDDEGAARMVDVTAKQPSVRQATAQGSVTCSAEVVEALRTGAVPKGDVLAVARVAGIAATKKVPDLLPLAHVIGVHGAVVDLAITDTGVEITATVRTADRTGVEMEALTAVAVAALVTKRPMTVALVLLSVAIVLMTFDTPLSIGVCKSADMACQATAVWLRVAGGVSAVAALAGALLNPDRKRVAE